MKITGIICEYNPLHLGHKKQMDTIAALQGPENGIVCLMSGNFVQRGAPAIIDKSLRAKAALLSGADLVLELPVTAAVDSAEGFASKGVSVLASFCSHLCFGAETDDTAALVRTAQALLSPDFPAALHTALDKGLSFPAARQEALEAMGIDGQLLTKPNNILAVEYCKAILSQNSKIQPLPILRQGDYHDAAPDPENPSATALRQLMAQSKDWESFVPAAARECFAGATLHTTANAERAILAKLRTMTDEDFAALPFGSEGLWRKLMHAAREKATLEDILTTTKSKRYTRSRLDRMVLCAFLGITQADLDAPIPYVRVLALNDKGRQILKLARKTGHFPNIGEAQDNPYQLLENRCDALYGLFADQMPEAPGNQHRIVKF